MMIMMMRSLVVMKMMAMTSLLGGEQGTMGTRSWLNIQQIMEEEIANVRQILNAMLLARFASMVNVNADRPIHVLES